MNEEFRAGMDELIRKAQADILRSTADAFERFWTSPVNVADICKTLRNTANGIEADR